MMYVPLILPSLTFSFGKLPCRYLLELEDAWSQYFAASCASSKNLFLWRRRRNNSWYRIHRVFVKSSRWCTTSNWRKKPVLYVNPPKVYLRDRSYRCFPVHHLINLLSHYAITKQTSCMWLEGLEGWYMILTVDSKMKFWNILFIYYYHRFTNNGTTNYSAFFLFYLTKESIILFPFNGTILLKNTVHTTNSVLLSINITSNSKLKQLWCF